MSWEPGGQDCAVSGGVEAERHGAMLAALAEGVILQDDSGRIVFCNPSAETILGLAADQMIGKTWADLALQAVRDDESPLPAQEHPANLTLRTDRACREAVIGLRRPGGTLVWISLSCTPLACSGKRSGRAVVSIFRDVTRQRASDLAVRNSEALYRALVENQGEGAAVVDLEGRFLFVNPAGEAIFGVPPGTLAGRSLFEFVSPGGAALIHAQAQEQMRGERGEYELEVIRESDGCGRTLLISATPRLDSAGKRVWSPLAKQFFGFPPDADVSFDDFINAVHPEDRERVRREVQVLYSPAHGEKSFSEFRAARSAEGQERWIASWGRAFFDEEGRLLRLIGITQDITERKRAEQALRESEARLRLTFDQAPIGAAMVGLDRRFLRVNDAFCRFLGYEARELVGSYMPEITHADDRPADRENARLLQEGVLDLYQVDKRYLRKDGSIVWGHVTVRLVRDESGRALYFMAMVEDITDRKRAEEERERLQLQLLHAQKMESIGRLAGGVAHDFNNLLTVINGYSTMALQRLHERDSLYEIIREIRNAGEGAAALVRQLLAFGRKQLLNKEPIDLNSMLRGIEKTLLPLLGENIETRTVLRPALSAVVADRHQIEQVILNLAVNARDAMPRGGVLTIETDEVASGPYCRRCGSPIGAGRYVCVTVRDNGMGMDEQTRQHLFEPFFSTKGASHGTGLGLATVHGIVLQSGGHIDVESRLEQGTSFYIYLPAAEAGHTANRPAENGAGLITRAARGEIILLVEDQPEVRRLTASVLQECGYGVLEAASAEEALARVATEKVDLVLTDVVLPKMSGCELADQVQSRQPGAKVLFMSGYSDEMLKRHGGNLRRAVLIQKPFAPEALAEKVRQALGAPPA